jgi:hypothetical protein
VLDDQGALAPLFADSAGTLPLANPFPTDTKGAFTFYAADGIYTLRISGTGLPTVTLADVILQDPAQLPGNLTVSDFMKDDVLPAADAAAALVALGAQAELGMTAFVLTLLAAIDPPAFRALIGALESALVSGYMSGTFLAAADAPTALAALDGVNSTQLAALDAAVLHKSGGILGGPLIMDAAVIVEARGADIVAATTTNIWAAGDGDLVHLTGNAAIASFGAPPQAGDRRRVIVDNACLLLHSEDLDCQGGANIFCFPGDTFEAWADSLTKVIVTNYARKDGTALAGFINPTAPTSVITAPADGAPGYADPAAIDVTVDAAAGTGYLDTIELYDGITLLDTYNAPATTATVTHTFNLAGVAFGVHSYTAKVTNDTPASVTSTAVNITVDSTPTSDGFFAAGALPG